MLFLNEYLSHGYTDTRRGLQDSTVWDGIQSVFSRGGDLKMSDKAVFSLDFSSAGKGPFMDDKRGGGAVE